MRAQLTQTLRQWRNFAKLLKWLRQSINGLGSASKVLPKHYSNVRDLALGYLAFASFIYSLRPAKLSRCPLSLLHRVVSRAGDSSYGPGVPGARAVGVSGGP